MGVREVGRWYYDAVEAVMLPVRNNLVLLTGVPRLWNELRWGEGGCGVWGERGVVGCGVRKRGGGGGCGVRD